MTVMEMMAAFGLPQSLRNFDEAPLDTSKHTRRRKASRSIAHSSGQTRQNFDALRRFMDRKEMKAPRTYGFDNIPAQNKMRQIRPRQKNALLARETTGGA